jgi:erythronate-4-phosphate dehydrogenase
MKIIADDKIPFLKGVLEPFADIVYVPGNQICHEHVKDADALIIRTRTRCNEQLLKNTKVSFIGTATIGYDHIDTHYCDSQGIVWKNAPGCNAGSVNQYIATTLFNLAGKMNFQLKDRTLGVVGVGNVGSKVVHTSEMLGLRVYLCDPPLVRSTRSCGFISLNGILRECDIITFHVPLNLNGPDKTHHMINSKLFNKVNPGTIIINTSRGEIADGNALKDAKNSGRIAGLVLDVWENEPDIDLELLAFCDQATPHIAGYSTDGKARGTAMIVHEISEHFGMGLEDWEADDLPLPENPHFTIDCRDMTQEEILKNVVQHTYDIAKDDLGLRNNPGYFEKLRGDYPVRREFKAYTIDLQNGDNEIKRICRKLGFTVI